MTKITKILAEFFANPTTDRHLQTGAWLMFVILAVWSIFGAPINMDEVLPYHVLACADHPAYSFHTFREGCDHRFELTTPFGWTFPRPSSYVGLISNIIYAPVYYGFHSPLGQYIFGLGFFALFAYWLSRLTSKPALTLPLFLCFFPVLFQFVHDTGPLKIEMLAFPLTALLFRQAVRSRAPMQVILGVAQAALFVLATEEKIFFLYMLLPALFFALAALHNDPAYRHPLIACLMNRQARRSPRLWAQALPALSGGSVYMLTALVLTIIGEALLLLSRTPDGQTYIAFVHSLSSDRGLPYVLHQWRLYSLYWASFAHRIYEPKFMFVKTPVQILTIFFLIACVRQFRHLRVTQNLPMLRFGLLGLSYMSVIAAFLFTTNVWAGHHYVYMWIPALIVFAELVSRLPPPQSRRLIAAFLGLNLIAVGLLALNTPDIHSDRERDRVAAYFADNTVAARSILNISAWGDYYNQALYAPHDALVTYIEPLNPEDAARLYDISRQTQRHIYDLCYGDGCSAPELADAFAQKLHFQEVDLGLREWHLFAAN